MVVPASEAVTESAKSKKQQVGGIRVRGDVEGQGLNGLQERLEKVSVGGEKNGIESGDREDQKRDLPNGK